MVEDDAATAENLLEIVTSLDCDAKATDNKQTATKLLAEHAFCFVLLDLQIKAEPDSIKGHTAHGNALLREIRTKYGGNRGSKFWTPILIVSGYAEEVDAAVDMMKNGADDIIRKPPVTDDVSKRLRAALQQAGRDLHASCSANVSVVPQSAGIVIGFSGDREGQRTIVSLSGCEVPLPDSSLKLLLQLAIAQEKREFVHQRELGSGDYGFKGVSRLRQELRPILGKGVDIIGNNRHGGYTLKPDATIRECDLANLGSVGNAEVERLARTLLDLITARLTKSDGN